MLSINKLKMSSKISVLSFERRISSLTGIRPHFAFNLFQYARRYFGLSCLSRLVNSVLPMNIEPGKTAGGGGKLIPKPTLSLDGWPQRSAPPKAGSPPAEGDLLMQSMVGNRDPERGSDLAIAGGNIWH